MGKDDGRLVRAGGETMKYADHYYHLGDVIRGAVKDAQELLCGLDRLRFRQKWTMDYGTRPVYNRLPNGHSAYVHPAGPPQSLGELSIELAGDYIRTMAKPALESYKRWPGTPWKLTEDIQNLRTLIYRKHTDPEEEETLRTRDKIIGIGMKLKQLGLLAGDTA